MTSNEPQTDDEPRKSHYYDLLNASPLVFVVRTLVIIVIALLVWWLARLPEPLIALSAIVIWVGYNAFKDVRDWPTR
jgi:hypothetical protein